MAEKAAAKIKTPDSKAPRKTRYGWLWLLLLVLVLIAGIWVGILAVGRLLFTRNDHFVLRNLELRCSDKGYWAKRKDVLTERLGIKLNRDNIFALDQGKLRGELLKIPSIESGEISRVLPDTLVISLVERIPRAALFNPNSRWVVDSEGVVMSRFEAMSIAQSLPVINGFGSADKIVLGMKLDVVTPALDLLMETIRNFPDISILYLNCSKPGKLEFMMRYRNQKPYTVIIPTRGRLSSLLVKLQSTIIELQRSGDSRNNIDLSFDGQIVIR